LPSSSQSVALVQLPLPLPLPAVVTSSANVVSAEAAVLGAIVATSKRRSSNAMNGRFVEVLCTRSATQ
jgi:hypothetical protein